LRQQIPSPERKTDAAVTVRPRYWVDEGEVLNRLAPPTEEEQEALAAGSLQLSELLRRQRGRARNWLLGFRDVTESTNERTAIFSFLPRLAVGHKAPLVLVTPNVGVDLTLCLVANLNGLVFDFVARQKIGGMSLSHFILKQLPVLPPSFYRAADVAYVGARVLELVYTADALREDAERGRA
jgi:hypothetical protein